MKFALSNKNSQETGPFGLVLGIVIISYVSISKDKLFISEDQNEFSKRETMYANPGIFNVFPEYWNPISMSDVGVMLLKFPF